MKTPIIESQVHSAYLDSDGSLHLYDKDENHLEGWPVGWPEEIKSVKRFLECRQINYVNRPRGMTALEKIMAESVGKDEELAKLRGINAKRCFDYIGRICEVCGHTKGHDDPECPNCQKAELEAAVQEIHRMTLNDGDQLAEIGRLRTALDKIEFGPAYCVCGNANPDSFFHMPHCAKKIAHAALTDRN